MIKYSDPHSHQEDSMNKLNRLFLALLLVVAAPLAFACDYPQKPDIPAGVTASKEDMIAASKAVKAYQTEMLAYRECIDTEGNQKIAELEEPEEEEVSNLKAALNKKYNASVEEEELIVARFNQAVRDYKSKDQ